MSKSKPVLAFIMINILALLTTSVKLSDKYALAPSAGTAALHRNSRSIAMSATLREYKGMMARQTDWISKLQTGSGAIRNSLRYAKYNPARYMTTPYFANLAAVAMAKDLNQLPNVKRYMQWYLSRLNWPDKAKLNGTNIYGTIYDYLITPSSVESSTNDYDSADSYAASFIWLVRSYYEAGGDTKFIISNKSKLDAIGDVMVKHLDKDNLSFAKHNHRVKYLMDNCEVYKGLKDQEFLYDKVFLDSYAAGRYKRYADKVKSSILNKLKNENEFYVANYSSNSEKADWQKWYPDSVAQIYPILYGVISPSDLQAAYLYNMLDKKWDWASLENSDRYPWVLVGYTGTMMNDRGRVEYFYRNLIKKYGGRENETDWYSYEAGWLVLMVDKMISNGWYVRD